MTDIINIIEKYCDSFTTAFFANITSAFILFYIGYRYVTIPKVKISTKIFGDGVALISHKVPKMGKNRGRSCFYSQLRTHLNINDIKANTETKTLSLGLMKKSNSVPKFTQI